MIAQLKDIAHEGLTTTEAQQRLKDYGANQIAEAVQRHPIAVFLRKFWGPIPWMLEATMLIQLALNKTLDAVIIIVLLIVNAVISYIFERRAQNALALLQEQLHIQSRVLRDGTWQMISAQELVPGDIIRLRAGDLVPADALVIDGAIAVDQSSLTGESNLVECSINSTAYAASVVRQGEAVAEISATGMKTSYSKTARLVQTARPTDQGEAFVQKVVTYLMGFTGILVLIVLINAFVLHLNLSDVLLFVLALLIAAIPVSLPVTFTLASAVGARKLAYNNVLASRLAAVKDAAGMDVLCTDKTGTITQNELTVVATKTYHDFSKSKLLRLAALASDGAAHDPIDTAIMKAADDAKRHYNKARRLEYTPFDPATKRTEALINRHKKTKHMRVVKGSPHIISSLTGNDIDLTDDVARWSSGGNRCIAIAAAKEGKPLKTVGLLALQDLPREDASVVVNRLGELGVRVVMVTGDDTANAQSIAHDVGITGETCPPDILHGDLQNAAQNFNVFARVYPEDKFKLVQALQAEGHIVGMTGDGVNDAPAIRQAEIGIAMNNATDITKSAASFILTRPGLKDMLSAIEVGRSIFQRITTYTLNKIIKTLHLGLFLTLGLILTGTLVAKPIHILLMVLMNDLVSMSLTTDQVQPSRQPNRWRINPLMICGFVLALGWLLFSFVVFFYGRDVLLFDTEHLNTLIFVMLVFAAGSNVYLIRERGFFWRSRPGNGLLLATAVDLVLVTILATQGILMTALNPIIILELLAATIGFMLVLDLVKVWLFKRFGIQQRSSAQVLVVG